MRPSRVLVWLLVIALVTGGAAALWQGYRTFPSSAAPGQDGWVSTSTGPLGPGDRDLLVRMRLSGLWQRPLAQQMVERATQVRVRDVGQLLADEDIALDTLTINAAHDVGTALPNQPTDDQRALLTSTAATTGTAFDAASVDTLRGADGALLPLLATVRANTRNSTVRIFAAAAAVFIEHHMEYTESTGLVSYAALPEPPAPARAVVTPTGTYAQLPIALVAIGAVLLLIGVVSAVLAALRRRRNRADAVAYDDGYDDGPPTLPHQAIRAAGPRKPRRVPHVADPVSDTSPRHGR